jgi:hypothetical protein
MPPEVRAAVPVMRPLKLPVVAETEPPLRFVAVVAVDALPERAAVIVPAEKLPDASRATIAVAVFALVALLVIVMAPVAVFTLIPVPLAASDSTPVFVIVTAAEPLNEVPFNPDPIVSAFVVFAVTTMEPPSDTALPLMVTDEFVSDPLAMLVSVLLAPLIVLFVSVSVVARPTRLSVAAGKVRTPEATAATTMLVDPDVAPAIVKPPEPMAGVTSDGDVANTRAPLPVSSGTAARRLAEEGVARNVATPVPNPLTPVEIGTPVKLAPDPLKVPAAIVPLAVMAATLLNE